jgi:ribonuclease T
MNQRGMVVAMEMAQRFRGFLPVVIDIETGGFDAKTHAVLELGAISLEWHKDRLSIADRWVWSVEPYEGGLLDPASLKVTGIDPEDPARGAISETEVVKDLFSKVRNTIKRNHCHRAIMVAHNAAFDQQFLRTMIERTEVKRDPFHPFSFIDTASLAAVTYGHTVLSEICKRAGIDFDADQAHGALYDAERTAEVFCQIVNAWGPLPDFDPEN